MNRFALLPFLTLAFFQPLISQVTTYHYDNNRTGATLNETTLNTSNVNVATFGKLFSVPVDAQIYAQPLYVPNVAIPLKGTHNVVYIATMNNSVYAYDADSTNQTAPLWQVSLGTFLPVSACCTNEDIKPQIGITGTPVIDLSSNTLYAVAETYENRTVVFRLHALDLTTGADKLTPAVIQGSVPGTSYDSLNGVVTFFPKQHWQRPGLLLLSGNIYIAFGSHQDNTPYHGWLFGYNGTTLAQTGIICFAPNVDENGIWQGGVAPAADSNGNIYVETGNGPFDANTGGSDYGDSIVKIATNGGMKIVDYFTPSTQANDMNNDWDLGSSGPLLIPGTGLGLAAGKDGMMYVFNTANLGQYNTSTNQLVQQWQATFSYSQIAAGGFWGGNYIYYNSTLYGFGERDSLKMFSFNGSQFNTTPVSQTPFQVPSGISDDPGISISANGTVAKTAIIWTNYSSTGQADGGLYPGLLRAFDASDVTKELWNSSQNSARDGVGSWAKWVPPIVANGKVYMATFDNSLNVYGLLAGGGTVTATGGTPQSATVNTAFGAALQLIAKDAKSNPMSGVTVTFTAPSTGASASLGGSATTVTATTNASGVATSPIPTANSQSGSYTIIATVPGVSGSTAFSLTNVAKAVSSVSATAGTPQSTLVSNAFATALQTLVSDENGNPLSGVTVTFSAPATGASATFLGSATATATTNASGVATAPQLTANAQSGSYTVTASAAGAATSASFSLTNSASVGSVTGNLNGTLDSPSTADNLTSEGTTDWVHWGEASLTRKAAVAAQITDYTVVGTGPVLTYTNDLTTLAWSDGTPVAAGSDNNGVYINSNGNGFSFTAPADTLTRSLTIHIGGYLGTGALTVHLSDSSAADFTDTVTGQTGQYDRKYTFTYNAASAAQTVLVTWVNSGNSGNVTLGGAALAQIQENITATAGTPQGTVTNTSFATALQATVKDSNNNPLSGITVTFTAPSTGASGSFSGSPTATATTNASGVATAPALTANGLSGAFSVTASAPGISTPAKFALTNNIAAIVLVQQASGVNAGNGQSTLTLQLPATPASADSLVLTFDHVNAAQNITSITGATWTRLAQNSGTSGDSEVWVGTNPTSAIITLTGALTFTGFNPGYAIVAEFTGIGTTLDGTPLLTSSGSWPITTGNLVTSNPSDLLITSALSYNGGGVGATISTQWSLLTPSPGTYSLATGYQMVNSPGTYSATWNGSGTSQAPTIILALKAAASSGSGSISASAGTPQSTVLSTAFTTALQASVKDAGGNPLSGVTITFTAPSTGASATFSGSSTATAVTNASGIATAPALTANAQTGSYSVTASAPGTSTAASFALTNTAAAPASIAASAGTPQSAAVAAAFATALQATVKDAKGNPLSGVTVTFTAPSTGASAAFSGSLTAKAVTNASGVATAPTLTANAQTGAYNVTASVSGVTAAASFALTNNTAVVSAAITLVQQAAGTNAGNNQNTLTVQLPSAPASTNVLVLTFDNISASSQSIASISGATWTRVAQNPANTGDSEVWVGSNPTSATITLTGSKTFGGFTPGYAIVAEFTGVGTTLDGTPLLTATGSWPVTTGKLATGNASDLLITSALSYNGGGVSATITAPWSLLKPTAGSYSLATGYQIASATGAYSATWNASGTSQVATIILALKAAGSSSSSGSIAASAGTPQSTVISGAFATPLQATVKDSGSNPLSGVTVTFTAPSTGPSAAFGGSATTTAVTNASGVATASALTANKQTGSYTVTASAPGTSTAASFALTNTAGAPASLLATAGTPQSAPLATAFSTALQATVEDAGSNPVSGITVTFTAPSTGASAAFGGLLTATAVTNSSGVATAPALTSNSQTGTYNVTASASGVATAASFSLTNTAAVSASIAASAGTPQSVTVSTAFATSLQATVKDAKSNPVSGVTVTFTAPSTGVSAAFGGSLTATAVTNSSGVATAPALTSNSQTGTYNVTASASGVSTAASFALTNTAATAAAPASVAASAGTPQSAAVAAAFATALQATVKDAKGNPLSGVTVTFTAPSTGASAAFSGSITAKAVTNASGIATAPALTANAQTGAYNVTASVSGVTTAASFALTNSTAVVSAAITLVQQAAGTNAGNNQKTLTVQLPGAPASTNVLVLTFDNVSASSQSITSISGATWTRVAQNPANTGDSEVWVGSNPTSATITLTGSKAFGGFSPGYAIVAEFTGVGTNLDGTPLLTPSGSWPATTGKLATSNATDLLITSALSYNGGGVGATITAPWSLLKPTSGSYSLAAGYQIASAAGTYSATWSGSGTPQVATIILALKATGSSASTTASAGTPQSTVVNTAFATPLQAVVKDAGSHLSSGVTVTFTAPSTGPSAGFGGSSTATAVTNASGVATAPALTANTQTGSYTVTASASATTTASFALTNTSSTASAGSIKLAQHTNINSGVSIASISVPFTAANAAGDWIGVAIFGGQASNHTFTVTDSNGNTYRSALIVGNTNESVTLGVYYAENIKAGANQITVTPDSSGYLRVAIFEYSGVATANSLDVISSAQGNGTALNSGNAVTTANGDLLLGAATTADANMLTAGPGYTLEEMIPMPPGTRLTVEDQIQATAGSTSAQITLDAAKDWAMGLAAFRKGA